jgi:tetratricopeptide (TPR) repeat protein
LSLLDLHLRGRGNNPGIVVLKGPGGVGKSAIALRWLDSARDRFPDGQLYAGLSSATGDPVAVEDVLGEFLRALGVAPERVPPGLGERASLFRSVTAGVSMAVLLEDAVSAAQVKALLPASPTSVVMVTSTRPLAALLTDGGQVVPVEPLDDETAMDLLAQHIGTERLAAEQAQAEALVRFCAGLPIALCVVAAQLVLRPHRPLAKLVAELRDEHRRLDVLSVDDDLSVHSTLDVSARALPADARSAYRSIGVHPGRLVCPELVGATTRFAPGRARRALDALVDASLLREIDDELYQSHDLVHAHARAAADAELDLDVHTAAVRATVEWHLFVAREAAHAVLPARPYPPFDFPASPGYELPSALAGNRAALGWLERHRLDLAAVIRLAADNELHHLAYALGDAMQPLFIVHKHLREAVDVDERALRAAQAMDDPRAEADMRNRLARTLIQLDDLTPAREHIDELIRTAQRRGDRRGLASGLKSLARLHSRLGRHDAAVAAFREVVAAIQEIDQGRATGLALTELGAALVESGQTDEAVQPLDEARNILLTTDPPDPYNAARATIPLARARLRLGDDLTARRLLAEAQAELTRLGSDYQLGRAHETLAELHETTGEPELAREHRDRADELFALIAGPAPDSTPD